MIPTVLCFLDGKLPCVALRHARNGAHPHPLPTALAQRAFFFFSLCMSFACLLQDTDKAEMVLPLALQTLRNTFQGQGGRQRFFMPEYHRVLEKNIELQQKAKTLNASQILGPLQKELSIIKDVKRKLSAGTSVPQLLMELQGGGAHSSGAGASASASAPVVDTRTRAKPKVLKAAGVNRKKARKQLKKVQ